MFVYRNSNTGDTIELPARSGRLDHLDVWLLIATPAPADSEDEAPPVLEEPCAGERAPAPGQAPHPVRPADNESKAAWLAYAITRGMPEADARALSKAALIEEFGTDEAEDSDGAD